MGAFRVPPVQARTCPDFWPADVSGVHRRGIPATIGTMEKEPDDRAAAGQVRRMRLLLGGRVEIEREIVRLCAQRHFDPARFDDLTRQLERPAKAELRVVTRGDLLPPAPPKD